MTHLESENKEILINLTHLKDNNLGFKSLSSFMFFFFNVSQYL
jgi:hypothetical protein